MAKLNRIELLEELLEETLDHLDNYCDVWQEGDEMVETKEKTLFDKITKVLEETRRME